MRPFRQLFTAIVLMTASPAVHADDFAQRCADRSAVERVYHAHRLGTQQPFEQAMPAALVEQLVRREQHKEAVLKKHYGVQITPEMVAAELRRIDSSTRAPEILAEIKSALGQDAARLARALARPIVVERELRGRFDNDDSLHAPLRLQAEQARAGLLAGKPVEGLQEAVWQLTPRPVAPTAPVSAPVPTQMKASSGAYRVEATAQLSQVIASPQQAAPGQGKTYFEDLDPELQRVLRAQLQKPGDVSAVIETPDAFLLFLVKARSAETLSVSSLVLSKRSYDEWLAQQPA
ncbi:MAG: hypothetical protein JNG86_13055 [Verrucomicrobiaceae bacterium]|nr:hypothetical protein [Verrucomicrobiaceae bacterium]